MRQPPQIPALSRRAQVWVLIAVALFGLVFGSSSLPLIDRDEPRFAQATREMMQRHDWLVPTFNGAERFDKPPLTYWLMSVFYRLGGVNELTARLHSILATVILGLVIYAAGARWFSAAIGFAAAFGFLTSLQVLLHGRLSVADMPMVLAVAVAQIALFDLLNEEKAGWRRWLFYGALALGFLAKGPVALAVPLVTALLYRFVFWRRPQAWGRLRLGTGLAWVLGLTALWGIPALLVTHGRWWHVGIGEHVVARGMEPLNSRHYFAPYYLLTSLLSFFPWIIFVGYGVVVLRRRWNARNAFLLSWLAAPYVLFTCYATQLPHYILPGFPAFFLILAQVVETPGPYPRWAARLAFGIAGLWTLILLALVAVLVAAPWQPAFFSLRIALAGLCLVFAGLLYLALVFEKNRLQGALSAVVLISLGFSALGNHLRPLLPALQVAKTIPANARCVAYGFTEGSLVFYADKPWYFADSPQEMKDALAQPGPIAAVALESEVGIGPALAGVWHHHMPEPKEHPLPFATGTYREISGIDFARASWVTIALYVRER